jgi:hypothetical protein
MRERRESGRERERERERDWWDWWGEVIDWKCEIGNFSQFAGIYEKLSNER